MAPIGVGTDGGGSIRIPAALCGVTGLKPGAGLVPTSGKGASRFSVVGPIAREVRDLALLLQVLAGPDPRDIYALEAQPPNYLDKLEHVPSGVRAAWWWEEPTETKSNPEAVALAREAAHAFVNFGAIVDEPNLGLDVSRLKVPHRLASWADLWDQEGETLYENLGHRGLLSPYLLETLRVGKAITGGEIAQALRIRDQFIHDLRTVFSAYDLLLAPTVADVAGNIEDKSFSACWAATHFTFPANFGGFAAATVPCGFVDGLPVGLQIIGPSGAEPLILRACRAFEMERPWAHVHPVLTSSPG